MRTKIVFSLLIMIGLSTGLGLSASALSLQVRPLLYKSTLKSNATKKGYVDVTNTGGDELTLDTSVQAFRQIDDKGNLEFFDDEQVRAGLIPDLTKFKLKPGQTERLYFLLRGDKLPSGDVFAALFVTSQSSKDGNIGQALRIGTLFTLINGTPGPRQAAITQISTKFWQVGYGIRGDYTVRNLAKAGQATGFYPAVTLQVDPLHQSQTKTTSLVFAGRERTSSFELSGARFGLYRVSVSVDGSQQSRWVFAVTGFWRWLTPLIGFGLLLVAGLALWRRQLLRRPRPRHTRRR